MTNPKLPRVVIDLNERFKGNDPEDPNDFWFVAENRGPETTRWADRFTEYAPVSEMEEREKVLRDEIDKLETALTLQGIDYGKEFEEAQSRYICAVKGRQDFRAAFKESQSRLAQAVEALEKIADPRKRHSEPDKYTELGCVMNIANEVLAQIKAPEAQRRNE